MGLALAPALLQAPASHQLRARAPLVVVLGLGLGLAPAPAPVLLLALVVMVLVVMALLQAPRLLSVPPWLFWARWALPRLRPVDSPPQPSGRSALAFAACIG